MNKIYEVIWSKTRNCYVVVSELAKRNVKGSGTRSSRMRVSRVLGALLVSAYLAGGFGVQSAWADEAGVAGSNVTRSGSNATAWGNGTKAEGSNATAWGYGTEAEGSNATAWGYGTVARGMNATSWGIESKAVGQNATAFGDSSVANGINSLAALGGITAEGATGSVAIGDGAAANLVNSIALGNASVANRQAGLAGYRPDGTAATGTAWIATANAISIGASANDSDTATVTRQITGVAAGTYDTDAVNVAQLKALQDAIGTGGSGATYTAGNGINIDTEDHNKISVKTGEGLEIGTSGMVQVKSGTVASNSDGFIKGAALYMELRPADGTYVKKTNTTAANLTALDKAVNGKAEKATSLEGYGITNAYTKTEADSAFATKASVNTKADKATTLEGYGITDAYTKTATDSAITKAVAGKANKATTLEGYGITDAYTKLQVDAKVTALSNRIGTISKNGAVVKAANTVSENLTALDTTLDNVKKTAEETKTDLQLIATVSEIDLTAISTLAEEINERTADIETIKAMNGTVAPEGEPGADEFLRGDTVYEELRPADGTYVKKTNTTAANLTELDTAVKNKADKATTLEGYGITDAYTKTQIDAKETALSNRIGTIGEDGLIIKADKNIAENLTLMDKALQDQTGIAKDVLDKKANADASNVGKNAKEADGTAADNSAAWGSALGTGEVESGNEKLVTGATVYDEVRLTEDGEYVKLDNTVAENLTVLDEQAKMTAEAVVSNTEKITENTQNIAKNTQDIATNAQNIAKNTQNIASNTENIAKNTQDIATNADNIVTAQKTADMAISGIEILLVGTDLSIDGIIAMDEKVDALAAQNGTVSAQGEAADQFIKGATVYNYLNDESLAIGENSTKIAMGQGSSATGTESIAIGNATGGQANEASGEQSIAIGFGNRVTGSHSGAFGDPTYIAADNSYAVGNSNNITAAGARSFAIGNNNTIGGSDTFVLGSNVNTDAGNAVVLGNGSEGVDGAVSVGSSAPGGQRRIVNVADGETPTDAATVGQVQQVQTQVQNVAQNAYNNAVYLNNSIHRLDSKVNKVGAGAAALAALHPIDMDNKFGMGMGYGNYRNAHAMALGVFYRPKDNLMFSIGGSMGNGENMLNAGVSIALDKGFTNSKAMMARTIKAQGAALEEQQKANAGQEAKIRTLEAENAAIREQNARLEARLAAIEAKLGK